MSKGKLVRFRGNVKGRPGLGAGGEGRLCDKTEEEMSVFLVGEKRFKWKSAVVCGNAQVPACEGKPGAEQGEM